MPAMIRGCGKVLPINPRKAAQISNRVLPAHQPQPLSRLPLRLKPIIQNLIQPLRLGLVAVDGILDFGRGVTVEVVGLALHGANAALHPDEPFDHLPVLVAVVGEGDGVVFVVSGAEVELDACAFEDSLGFAGGVVDDCWDAAVCCRVCFVTDGSCCTYVAHATRTRRGQKRCAA